MKAEGFLNIHRLGCDFVDEKKIAAFFQSEMEKGLNGEKSSLKMIATHASSPSSIPSGESVIVMDAGGTNFRTCLVTFSKNGKAVITDFRKVAMPGVERKVSADEFYSVFASSIECFLGKSSRIGFCFSYAAEITEDHDGIPILFSKEIKADGVIGKPLGKNILSVLSSRGHDVSGMKVSVVNDTVATLLAAQAEAGGDAAGYIGFILGTGTNTAYVEKNSNIGKITAGEGEQIINTESGSLRIELTSLDKEFLLTTNDPSSYHLEKMISGAYIGSFAFYVLKKAVEEGVFSSSFSSAFSSLRGITTIQVGSFLLSPWDRTTALGSLVSLDEDSRSLYLILKAIVVRAALLTAINLSAAVLKSGVETSPSRPVVINADGTTFYRLPFLESYTRYFLDRILEKENGIYYRIVNIESSPIIGAAISALAI